MKTWSFAVLVVLSLVASVAVAEDEEGCKDHPLFNRMPNARIAGCQANQFDLRKFPIGEMPKGSETLKSVAVEGAVQWLKFEFNEGAGQPPSGLQIQRNFENATKAAGGRIEGSWPGWCKAMYDGEGMPNMGNGCTSFGLTMKFQKNGKEIWAFLQAGESDGAYSLTVAERAQMKQDISASEIGDKLAKVGFVALYLNFDTGKATIQPDSNATLDTAAEALKANPTLRIEVGGHTDNVGNPEANQKLSHERAQAVMAALSKRGIKADRLTAKGYGQTMPVADNRLEDGRAKNRRVELVKQ
ncbi:MAG: OmpA family protein [Deltaproteobacteria bacterium]|nr:OmpA family protein [Deltaproteobacteria bacterium]